MAEDLADVGDEMGDIPVLVTIPSLPTHMDVGKRDLVADLDSPFPNDFAAAATVSRDFVRGIIKFGPTCLADIVSKAVDLVLAY